MCCLSLGEYNNTELRQLVIAAKSNVPRTLTKEQLLAFLHDDLEAPTKRVLVDNYRIALMRFVLDHWNTIRSQLDCPAKSGNPLSCFNCVDQQVLCCMITNHDNEARILQRMEKEPMASLGAPAATSGKRYTNLAEVPRDLAALTQECSIGFVSSSIIKLLVEAGVQVHADEKSKMAFLTATPVQRAEKIFALLQAVDGGAPAAVLAAAPVVPAAAPVIQKPAATAQPQQTVLQGASALLASLGRKPAVAPTPTPTPAPVAAAPVATPAPAPAPIVLKQPPQVQVPPANSYHQPEHTPLLNEQLLQLANNQAEGLALIFGKLDELGDELAAIRGAIVSSVQVQQAQMGWILALLKAQYPDATNEQLLEVGMSFGKEMLEAMASAGKG